MKPLITLPCLALCACGAVNPVTALRLATLDPLTADPGAFIVRLDLPDGVGIEDGGATLSMQATRGADTRGGTFDIVETVPGSDIWRIAPDQLDALHSAQSTIAAWEAEAPDETTGSLSVDVRPCQLGDGPAETATLSVFLQLEPGGPFAPLLSEVAVRDLTDGAMLPACDRGP